MIKTIKYADVSAKVTIRDPADHLQKYWAQGSFYEAKRNGLLPYIYGNYENFLTYLDVGASIGNHSLFFVGVMMAGQVISVEPYPPSVSHLVDNVALNGWEDWVDIRPLAASNKPGTVEIGRYGEDNIGMVRVMPEGEFQVSAVTLDSIVGDTVIDIVKVDVEHYNAPVLEGATRLLDEQDADWFIECENEDELQETDAIMAAHGYVRDPNVQLNATPTYLYTKP